MEFTCSLLNIKLTEIFKVKFCTNYEKFTQIVTNFREISLSYILQSTRARAHTHTHKHTNKYTHTYTHISNTVPVCEGIYLMFISSFPVALCSSSQ